jgi:glutamyl-tRNA synthetase
MSKIRTRFAPSPTGRMHVGNLRTALYAYLIAKHEGGDFLLRIEDTDQERFMEGALEIIYRTLEKTGLVHDEGPDKDGGVGPYVQSERQAQGLYLEYAKKLIEKGEAYYCFCTKERLESLKTSVGEESEGSEGKEIAKYDKHCLSLSKEEVEQKLQAGIPYVIRQNNPTEGETTFHDVIFGDITVENAELDDMILIKSDGFPTYNFANVIDDHLMGITHVVRGNEYLSSTPKYNRLYEAFGWEIPVYIHCPVITNEEHKKLSKRSGHSSYEDLIEQGFLTEAVVNFVSLLGWSPAEDREIFSLKELVEVFDYHRINKAPAVFDMVKLKWMNGEYMKAMDFEAFYTMAEPYLREVIHKELDLRKIAALVKTRIEIFPDMKELIDFFETVPDYDLSMYTHKKMKTNQETSLLVLKEILPKLEAWEDYSNDALYQLLVEFVEEKGYKNGYVMWPIRTAVSGKQMTPGGATEIMEIIGKEESLTRIRAAIQRLEEADGK